MPLPLVNAGGLLYKSSNKILLIDLVEDPREGKPSASYMQRLMGDLEGKSGCPGAFRMEKGLKDPSSKSAANRGVKIHDVLGGLRPWECLSHSDRICAERMAFEEAQLVEKLGLEGGMEIRERRLKLLDSNFETILSGQPDIIRITPKVTGVINYKTGFYPPTPIHRNCQMLAEGVLAALNSDSETYHVALIHPNYQDLDHGGRITQAQDYSRDYLINKAKPILEKVAIEAMSPEAKRNPSEENCKFCLGKKCKACPEYLRWSKNT